MMMRRPVLPAVLGQPSFAQTYLSTGVRNLARKLLAQASAVADPQLVRRRPQRAGSKASSIVGSVSSGSMEALRPDDLPAGWASVASKPPPRRTAAHPQDQHRNWLVFEVMDTGQSHGRMLQPVCSSHTTLSEVSVFVLQPTDRSDASLCRPEHRCAYDACLLWRAWHV